MESESIIIDSSVIISYFWTQDSNHSKAIECFNKLDKFQTIYITNLLVLEIVTVLSQRIGKIKVQDFVNTFIDKQKEVFVSENDNKTILNEYLFLQNKNVSFVDLSTCFIAKKFDIKYIATFDKHFNKLGKEFGFKVL